MCAITGIFGEKISAKLHEMLLSLKHRGPDMSGVYVDGIMSYGKIDDLEIPEGKVGLGHNFLSIPGSDTVQLLNEGNIFLACDCEIYNYKNYVMNLYKHLITILKQIVIQRLYWH